MDSGKDEAYWRAHLVAIDRAGITTKAYAEREGIAVWSLYDWRRRLKEQDHRQALVSAPLTRPRFVAVELVGSAPQAPAAQPCTLVVGKVLRLELQGLPDAQWLAAVGAALAAGDA